MIDWVTAKLPCNNNIRSGCVAKLDADGNVEWLTQSFMSVEGSHESSVGIKSLTLARFKYLVILLNGCKVIIFSVQTTLKRLWLSSFLVYMKLWLMKV